MSRFVEILEEHEREITVESTQADAARNGGEARGRGRPHRDVVPVLHREEGAGEVKSLLDYEVTFLGEYRRNGSFTMKVVVPVTSLCPCSKKISQRGAHNQRPHVTVTVRTHEFVDRGDRRHRRKTGIERAYGLLKRPDEKFVTERAYDNPKFVEDMVRDVAAVLKLDERIDAYVVESRTSSRSTTTAPMR